MHTVPFHLETFKPISIKGNTESDHPVTFECSAAGGPDKARLKSLLIASAGLEVSGWSPETQASVIEAFKTGAQLFERTVGEIRNLKVPAALAKHVGLIDRLPPEGATADVAVTTGTQFSAVAGFTHILAFEVAMKIAELSRGADIDPRFFPSLSTSLQSLTGPNGSAPRVQPRSKKRGTADGSTIPDNSRASTS